ncbi:MAG: signal peptide peptidase SppA [Bacteroidetes bacterium]|nr:signal peptide peptidase SppA [Bacteroidota bacterium]
MKQFFKMFFASFLALIVMGIIVFGLTIGLVAGLAKNAEEEAKEANANSVLVLDMGNAIHENGEVNPMAAFIGGAASTPGLYDLSMALENAKSDKNIKGIYIKLSESPNGWATLQQLRQSLLDFKSSGKFIYAYGEMVPQKSYFLASTADSIFINPVGFTEFKGMATQLAFFKGTLEKLEIQPEIFYAGKFKSATEPFRADKMSEPNREQITALQNGIWNELTNAVAKHASVNATEVDSWAKSGRIQFPEDAVKAKLADRLAYIDEVEATMRKKLNKKADEKIDFISIEDYSVTARKARKTNDQRIAVLFAEGNITDGKTNDDPQIASEDMIEQIRKIAKNEKVKAVVLRVNSPGGSALASDVILRELNLLKQKKPLIVSMGDLAASGGYYISCQADSIFAMPTTITGSIGVFSMMFSAEKLLKNKLGVTFDEVKNAPYADFPTATRTFTPEEATRMQTFVDTIYSVFKHRVVSGRKLSDTVVDSIAQGRVWTGVDALRIGLIDGLGGIDRAILSAAKKAGLKEYQVSTYPQPLDKFESMMRRFKMTNASATAAFKSVIENEISADYPWLKQIKNLKNLNGKVQMALPFDMQMK